MALNRFYYPTKFKTRNDFLLLNVKCVFISYQQKDKNEAKQVADYFQNAGIDVYFDEYDTELRIHHQGNNPKKVTESICNGINNSSHMIVIVSPNTVNSSWVPFEIGYGFEKTDLGVLCLKGIPKGSLPEYIRTAPIIRDIYDLNNLIGRLTGKPREVLLETKMMSSYDSGQNPLTRVMDSLINDQY
ncbi:toll/interleukin-1 receptor domain-containing protein [Ferruginibacter paludis]|uniref:toll/interleukin-1 receptor domain-containing protein n=1 Tax=Ferruginibacter paludis TaxID=1310417 RepID=UPI0025B35A23|nr:toll/interleukin-1 receptor domain-containing protein [Ferruginibacter paludis]MDN3657830.1 toll/interleukin-1 receptor domain-containing protein [Ferruginibacter paludis]